MTSSRGEPYKKLDVPMGQDGCNFANGVRYALVLEYLLAI